MTNNANEKNYNLEILFSPITLGSLKLANRIVMAPMTRGFSPNSIPDDNVAGYYRRRAENQVGLIITEGTLINHPAASQGLGRPNFYGEAALKGWAHVVEQVHQAEGKIMPQLWHVGTARKTTEANPNPEALPIGPSGLDVMTGEKVNEPMTIKEIEEIVQAFATAALAAKDLGFDGIELHGAHGYLIDQFFWEKTNQRQDKYGGNLRARSQFAVEIVRACRAAVGPDYPIVFRYSQWKMGSYDAKLATSPEELAAFLLPLTEAGVDIFHCSTRRYWEPEFAGSGLNLAGWTKKITGKPTITVGSVGLDTNFTDFFTKGKGAKTTSILPLLERLENKEFDLVAVGRALLADPAWAVKVRTNRINELIPFEPGVEKTLS